MRTMTKRRKYCKSKKGCMKVERQTKPWFDEEEQKWRRVPADHGICQKCQRVVAVM